MIKVFCLILDVMGYLHGSITCFLFWKLSGPTDYWGKMFLFLEFIGGKIVIFFFVNYVLYCGIMSTFWVYSNWNKDSSVCDSIKIAITCGLPLN